MHSLHLILTLRKLLRNLQKIRIHQKTIKRNHQKLNRKTRRRKKNPPRLFLLVMTMNQQMIRFQIFSNRLTTKPMRSQTKNQMDLILSQRNQKTNRKRRRMTLLKIQKTMKLLPNLSKRI